MTLTIDWPGTGDRTPHIESYSRTRVQGLLLATMDDYGKAIDFLAGQNEVDQSRLGYLGYGLVSDSGLSFAAVDQRFKAVAAIGPYANTTWHDNSPHLAIQKLSNIAVYFLYSTSVHNEIVCGYLTGAKSKKKRFEMSYANLIQLPDEVANDALQFLKDSL